MARKIRLLAALLKDLKGKIPLKAMMSFSLAKRKKI